MDITMTTEDGNSVTLLHKTWNCTATDLVEKKYVKLKLPDSIMFRPNYYNNRYVLVVPAVSVRLWMLDKRTYLIDKQRGDGLFSSTVSSTYELDVLSPYSRPKKRLFRSCPSWSWTVMSTFGSEYWMTCLAQKGKQILRIHTRALYNNK